MERRSGKPYGLSRKFTPNHTPRGTDMASTKPASTGKPSPSKNGAPKDAIELLMADHRTVEGLFETFEATDDKGKKQKIAQQICLELMVHSTIEEEIFYPAIKEVVEDDLYNEAFVEHDGAKMMIAEILEGSADDDFYDAKVKVLSEMIKHHVKEEEKRSEGLLAQARTSQREAQDSLRKFQIRRRSLSAICGHLGNRRAGRRGPCLISCSAGV